MKKLALIPLMAIFAICLLTGCADTAPADTVATSSYVILADHSAPEIIQGSITTPAILVQDTGEGPTDPAPPIGVWGWIGVAAVFLTSILSAVQYLLKRIPTERSEKIQGIIGKILDFLTFWQPDNISRSK